MKFESAFFETSVALSKQMGASTLPEIVFSGRSNVGKSSLLNRVLGRKALARVSAKPGKTITINLFRLDTVRFVDLPGYGFARRSHAEKERWSRLVEDYFGSSRRIALVVQLVDMRHPCSPDDLQMINYLIKTGLPFLIVLTKKDKLNKTELAVRQQELKQQLAFMPDMVSKIECSSTTGDGIDALRGALLRAEAAFREESSCL